MPVEGCLLFTLKASNIMLCLNGSFILNERICYSVADGCARLFFLIYELIIFKSNVLLFSGSSIGVKQISCMQLIFGFLKEMVLHSGTFIFSLGVI